MAPSRGTRAAAAVAAALACACGSGQLPLFLQRTSQASTVQVIGHRGARSLFPENSLAAFHYAIAIGADAIELDVVVTADDALLLHHDFEVNRNLCSFDDGSQPPEGMVIHEQTLATLQLLDCGSKPNAAFPRQQAVVGSRLVTLDQIFEHVAAMPHPGASEVFFLIDAKSSATRSEVAPAPDRFAELLLASIRDHGMQERSVVQAFDHRVIREVRAQGPEIHTAALVGKEDPDLVGITRAAEADIMAPPHDWVTSQQIEDLHATDVAVLPWTANGVQAWERLTAAGVDGIITDDPEALLDFLQQPRTSHTQRLQR